MNERHRRVILNIAFWLTICALFTALLYLIRSDPRGWRASILELVVILPFSVLSLIVLFKLRSSGIMSKLRRRPNS